MSNDQPPFWDSLGGAIVVVLIIVAFLAVC